MAAVIRAENLGKKYSISHAPQERYTALRDVITNKMGAMGRKMFGSKREQKLPGMKEDFWALKNVSFEIKQGERVGVIGRNGAGKSTLLKVLSRITEPTEGRVEIAGRTASLLEVGTGFHPELTGRENIFLNGAILGMTKAEIRKKFDEIVDFAEVEKFLDTPVKRYSSGMYVRLAFAVAAHLEPEILIVDEVLAVGDAQFQRKCLGKMRHVSQEGRTILFVSHNMSAVNELCNEGIVLEKGEIIHCGSIEDSIALYLSERRQSNKIIAKINYMNDALILRKVEVNESDEDTVFLSSDQNAVKIFIQGVASEKLNLSLEAKLYDKKGNVVGMFSPGHIQLNIVPVHEGPFNLDAIMELPLMTKGDYLLDINLLDPGYRHYCAINSAVTICKESVTLKTFVGKVFENKMGHGSILFCGNVAVRQ